MNLILGGEAGSSLGGAGGAGAHGAGGQGGNPPGTISVSQEEMEAIERLTSLGFSKNKAAEAYFACDKNEELAANYLFDAGTEEDEAAMIEESLLAA